MGGPVILVDWGTTNFRAWLATGPGVPPEQIVSDGPGMASLAPGEFPEAFSRALDPWRSGSSPVPVYMAGMVGAATGWQAAPQLPLPVTLADLAGAVVPVDGFEEVWIVPGVRVPGEAPDVMRGEEVQIFGAFGLTGRRDAMLCLPGTHSKWARVEDDTLITFTTSMTGEVHAVMMAHSLLGREASGDSGPLGAAFDEGLAAGAGSGGLLHQLFAARSRRLFGDLGPDDVRPFLSGVLIASEIAAMATDYPPGDGEVLLVGSQTLRGPYERALEHFGYVYRWIDASDATLRGLFDILQCRSGGR
ncbi:MAG: 2-dehydro-3-deoxygalactonokinase [Hyphomicrobiales bacterium]|nr:MAG: 2-dehydro-3-deoxygalactonokinase [Hyphomicrobiales bacterium]